jgi:hypothetical protein
LLFIKKSWRREHWIHRQTWFRLADGGFGVKKGEACSRGSQALAGIYFEAAYCVIHPYFFVGEGTTSVEFL